MLTVPAILISAWGNSRDLMDIIYTCRVHLFYQSTQQNGSRSFGHRRKHSNSGNILYSVCPLVYMKIITSSRRVRPNHTSDIWVRLIYDWTERSRPHDITAWRWRSNCLLDTLINITIAIWLLQAYFTNNQHYLNTNNLITSYLHVILSWLFDITQSNDNSELHVHTKISWMSRVSIIASAQHEA